MDSIKIYKGRRKDMVTKNLVSVSRENPKGVEGVIRDLHLVTNWYINLNRGRFKYTVVGREELQKRLEEVIAYVAKDAKVEVPRSASTIVNMSGIFKNCCNLSDEELEEIIEDATDTSRGFNTSIILSALQQLELQLKFDGKIMMCNVPDELIHMMKSNEEIRKDLINEILDNCGELKCYSLSPKIAELFEMIFGY